MLYSKYDWLYRNVCKDRPKTRSVISIGSNLSHGSTGSQIPPTQIKVRNRYPATLKPVPKQVAFYAVTGIFSSAFAVPLYTR